MRLNKIIHSDKFRQKRAMTLIELILALAILLIVLTIVFSFNLFGIRVFGKGTDLSDLQFDVRMASDFIFSETRNASEILLDTPSSPDEYNRIFIDSNKIAYQSAGGSVVYKSDAIIQNPSTDMLFSIVDNGSSYMLEFTIDAATNVEKYSLSTNVLLNNIKSSTAISSKPVLYYKKAVLPSPTASPAPTNSPIPTSSPIPTIGPTESPTASPTHSPSPSPGIPAELTVTSVNGTGASGMIEFSNNISDCSTNDTRITLEITGSNIVTLTISDEIKNNTNFHFFVTDEFDVTKKVTVLYQNHKQPWQLAQVEDL